MKNTTKTEKTSSCSTQVDGKSQLNTESRALTTHTQRENESEPHDAEDDDEKINIEMETLRTEQKHE